MAGPFSLAEIVERVGGECVGDARVLIHGVGSLRGAGPGDIAFLSGPRYRRELEGTRAAAVIVPAAERDAVTLPRIVVADPYLCFAQVATLLHPASAPVPGTHAHAMVDPAARVSATARVDAGAVVEAGAAIGEGAWIGAGCWIGAGAAIGAGSRLYGGVRIYPGCVIGERCILHAGSVIGADGFGFAPHRGAWFKIPQLGRVLVGNDVEIGANTTIDRGALDDTVIEEGVKLDNQIQIAHNCRIGAHTAIAACVGIAGSTTIGKNCMIGGAAIIAGHVAIGDRVVIAAGTGVNKSISEPGMYASALPAAPVRDWRRMVALMRNLDRMSDRLRRLERPQAQQEDDD